MSVDAQTFDADGGALCAGAKTRSTASRGDSEEPGGYPEDARPRAVYTSASTKTTIQTMDQKNAAGDSDEAVAPDDVAAELHGPALQNALREMLSQQGMVFCQTCWQQKAVTSAEHNCSICGPMCTVIPFNIIGSRLPSSSLSSHIT